MYSITCNTKSTTKKKKNDKLEKSCSFISHNTEICIAESKMNGWIIIVRATLYRDCYTISGSEISMTNHDNDISRIPHRRISRGYNQQKTAHGLPYQAMAPRVPNQPSERATKRTLTCMLTLRTSSGVMARWLVAAANIPPPVHNV
jgi:hypothetical protein